MDTIQSTLSTCTHNDRSRNLTQDWFEFVNATNETATSITDLFHKKWFACYLQPQFIFFDNGNVGKFKHKCVCKTIMALKSNQLQVTTHIIQANAMIE
jgi:hypothetical protein